MAGIKITARRAGEDKDRLLGVLGSGALLASNGDFIDAPQECTVEQARTILAAYLWTVGFDAPFVADARKVEVLYTFMVGKHRTAYRLVRFEGQRLLQQESRDWFGSVTWLVLDTGLHSRELLRTQVHEKMLSRGDAGALWCNGHVRIHRARRANFEVRNETDDGWRAPRAEDLSERDEFDIYATALSPEGERFYQSWPDDAEFT